MRNVILLYAALAISIRGISQLTPFTSSDLPIVVLTTGGVTIVDEPKVVIDMGIIYNGPGVTNNITDPFNDYNGKVAIELRGSSSQMFPKKQYGLELRDVAGADIEQSLLGLPAEGDWILFAPYNDKTMMRDVLAYNLTRGMGRYASRTKYCELVIDGEYRGVYVLLEKIKRGGDRVDIAKLEPLENSGDDLTGGYIIKLDKNTGSANGGGGFESPFPPPNRAGFQTIWFQYEYPKSEVITAEQRAYIRNFMVDFEVALDGANYLDAATGYRKYIDVESFVDFHLMNELTKNPDAYRLSTFMYKDKDSNGGKLHMGPVWDFNLGFGNVNYCTNSSPSGYVTDFNLICNGDWWLIPFWWNRLWSDPVYRNQLHARWTELRSGPFETSRILGKVDSIANVLNAGPQQRNFQYWPVLGTYVWPNPPETASLTTFAAEVDWLKDWITDRLFWMDGALAVIVTGTATHESAGTSIRPYPNPFDDRLNFEYSIAEPGNISILVHDALGREVASMVEYQHEPGTFTTTSSVGTIAAGLYFYRMEVNGRACGNGMLSKR